MNIEEIRDYCLAKPGVTEDMPFGEDTLVFRVGQKLFLLTSLSQGDRFNAKCDPELAIELREQHAEVQPGYHMNKKHWNTVHIDGNLSHRQICDMIDHSYDLVLKSLPKNVRERIK